MIADLGYFNLSIPVLLKPLTGCPGRTVHRRDIVRVARNSDPSSDWCLVTAAGHDAKLAGVKLLIHGHGYLILNLNRFRKL